MFTHPKSLGVQISIRLLQLGTKRLIVNTNQATGHWAKIAPTIHMLHRFKGYFLQDFVCILCRWLANKGSWQAKSIASFGNVRHTFIRVIFNAATKLLNHFVGIICRAFEDFHLRIEAIIVNKVIKCCLLASTSRREGNVIGNAWLHTSFLFFLVWCCSCDTGQKELNSLSRNQLFINIHSKGWYEIPGLYCRRIVATPISATN